MEETLTDNLVRVREDLRNLNGVREYLDKNAETNRCCSVTWRTIEAFNSILDVCSSQHETAETSALDTLLDSFYYLAINNTNPGVWKDFGFEMGIICMKVLSAIERCEIFEILFCKLLTIINIICEHNSNVWKAAARQILNVFINKKFSPFYFEAVLKQYICTLKNVESSALHNFSSQNLHLLKTLSMLVPRVGDFEIQSDIMELVFLHLSNDTGLMSDFFATAEKKLFESLQFTNFEGDCRTYLNALNKPRGGFEKKIYSICCHVLYLGGCFVEPPVGGNFIWVDANRETQRLSIKCGDIESETNRVIYILFSDILQVHLENEKTEGNRCLTIQTKSLAGLNFEVKNDDICLVAEKGEALFEFVNYLNAERKKKKLDRKVSKTMDSLLIDRNKPGEVQDSAITSSEKQKVDHILPDILNLFERASPTITNNEIKTSQTSRHFNTAIKTPPRSQERRLVAESQELSPNSFVESLNKHIGRDSPEIPRTFEDSVETIEFLQKSTPRRSYRLFRSPDNEFPMITNEKSSNFNFIFDEDKENKTTTQSSNPKLKTYKRKREKLKSTDTLQDRKILRDKKNVSINPNTESQDYFQQGANVLKKKKPIFPKLRRSMRTKNKQPQVEDKLNKQRLTCRVELERCPEKNEQDNLPENQKEYQKVAKSEIKCQEKQKDSKKISMKSKENQKLIPGRQKTSKPELDKKSPKQQNESMQKPSLLDPNGYAYRRWCEPTTSERGNFWLKKLNAIQKPKIRPENVFDFSENSDSDSTSRKSKTKKRKVVHSKRSYLEKKGKQTSLKQVKEILRNTSSKGRPSMALNPVPQSPAPNPYYQVLPGSPESFRGPCYDPEPSRPDCTLKSSSVCESLQPECIRESDGELAFSSEEEEDSPTLIKKRERSDEDNSLIKAHIKKKSKTVFPYWKFFPGFHRRLQEKEEKNRQQTNEIIRTVGNAVDHLFNYLLRKKSEKVTSYLTTAKNVSAAVESEVQGLNLRAKRIHRVLLYYHAGCSVSDLDESLESQFAEMRTALRNLTEKKDVTRTIGRVSDRLEGLIKSEIEKSISSELALRRNRLLKCATIFGANCGEFS